MTTGRVDLKVVLDRLEIAGACLRDLRSLPAGTLDEFLADRRNPAAAESLLRRAIEALLDVGRHILAKGFGQAALEYRQIALLAVEKGILGAEAGRKLALMAGYRNRLTHFYAEVTPAELYGILKSELSDVEVVAEELKRAARRLAAGGSGA